MVGHAVPMTVLQSVSHNEPSVNTATWEYSNDADEIGSQKALSKMWRILGTTLVLVVANQDWHVVGCTVEQGVHVGVGHSIAIQNSSENAVAEVTIVQSAEFLQRTNVELRHIAHTVLQGCVKSSVFSARPEQRGSLGYHELLGFHHLAQQDDEKKACARMLARLTANVAKATGDWGLSARSWEDAL